jgi:hypothetical protein
MAPFFITDALRLAGAWARVVVVAIGFIVSAPATDGLSRTIEATIAMETTPATMPLAIVRRRVFMAAPYAGDYTLFLRKLGRKIKSASTFFFNKSAPREHLLHLSDADSLLADRSDKCPREAARTVWAVPITYPHNDRWGLLHSNQKLVLGISNFPC